MPAVEGFDFDDELSVRDRIDPQIVAHARTAHGT